MADNKSRFKTVPSMDMDDYKQKLREHRLKILKRVTIIIFIILLIGAGLGLFLALRHYEDFDVVSTAERSDTAATIFQEFNGNILKYSNDGALYTDASNERIWNQTYEMANPTIDICGGYLTIYDKKGSQIYILNQTGLVGSIETTMAIEQVSIASQGTVAVLMQNQSTGYLAMYDKSGTQLVNGAIHGENGGYPIAIALSNDAIKLAVSMMDINDGNVKTTIAFYNFGSVGENEIDHIVAANSFSDMVIPEMHFTSNDTMIAFGDSEIIVFEGTQKPKLTKEIPLATQAKSIFYCEKYIGVVTSNNDEELTQHVTVYDLKGNSVMEQDFSMEYTNIQFLSNSEVCITDQQSCDIYTIRGIYKFHYEFEQSLYDVIAGGSGLNYTFILEGTTEKVRLK